MSKIQLLDCTLRDGGYLNDWEFGHGHMLSIFERLVDAGVDIVEVGFLDKRRAFDCNRSIGPDTKSLETIWGNITKRPKTVMGMIDFGTCPIENLQPAKDSFLDGIRVIFKKQKMHEAMAFCKQVKDLGYIVFSQLVSITSYSDDDLLELIDLVNEVRPNAVSIVDTYGLLQSDSLLHYAKMLDERVAPGIGIGYHAHNNFQLAFSNVQAFLSFGAKHDLVVDGTLFGMGKSAGNAPLELVAMHLNERYGKNYKIQPMLEAIEDSIMPFRQKYVWGYQKFFYMVAKEKCHPNYLTFFQNKGNLSQSDLDTLLSMIEPEDKKLLYDEQLAESMYKDFIESKFNDDATCRRLSAEISSRNILLLGPGKNIVLQSDKVRDYINQNHPVIISINYLPTEFPVDYVFFTKTERYEENTLAFHDRPDTKIIATSNMTPKNKPFSYVFTRVPLLEEGESFIDNSFLMMLRILKKAGIVYVACAGFDGYSPYEDNYADPTKEYDSLKPSAKVLNRHVQKLLKNEFKSMQIDFVTYSHYNQVVDAISAAD